MEKKVIIFIFTLFLTAICSASEEDIIPALPVADEIIKTDDNEISYWQKIKNFFGLGDNNVNEKITGNSTTQLNLPNNVDENTSKVETNLPENIGDSPVIIPQLPSLEAKKELIEEKTGKIEKKISPPETVSLMLPEDSNEANKNANTTIVSVDNSNTNPVDKKSNVPTSTDVITIKDNDDINAPVVENSVPVKNNSSAQSAATTVPENKIPLTPIASNSSLSKDEAKNLDIQIKTKSTNEELKVPDIHEGNIVNKDEKNTQNAKGAENNGKINTSTTVEVPQLPVPAIDNTKISDNTKKEISAETQIVPASDLSPEVSAKSNIVSTQLVPTEADNIAKDIQIDKEKDSKINSPAESLVPNYASENIEKTNDENLLKYKSEFKNNKDELKIIPKISDKNLINMQPADEKTIANDIKVIEFIKNEAQVLTLPNDEIVLGCITDEAKYDQMDIRTYFNIFWHEYNELLREPKRKELQKFIKNYNANFNENY